MVTMKGQDGKHSGNGSEPPRRPSLLEAFKEFRLTSFAVDHRTSVLVLLLIILVLGAISYEQTPKESFPEMAIPMLAINTVYPGVSPADVESQVTRVLEEDLSTISDLKELRSTSVEGYSSITAEFETTMDLNEALQKVREKVDLAKPDLPPDAEEPSIVEFNFSEVPIMQVNLSGDYGLVRLKELGEDLQDRLETIPSVLRVDLRGGLEREVKVDVDLNKLQFYGVSLDDVISTIRNENVNIPGGSIDVGETKYLVRVDGEFDDPSVIENFVVTVADGRPVYVRDVATVDFGFSERESYSRMNGSPVVTLDVIKRSGENIIETSDAVKAEIDAMRPLFPPTTEVRLTSDQSKEINLMVSSLENNIVSGLILIVGVLLFFLGAATSMFVAVSIPSSMFLSFIVLKLHGDLDEHGRAVQPHPRAGHAGGQRDRRGREHVPVPRGGMGPGDRREEGDRRGGGADHRVHRHDARRVRAAPVLAGPDRLVHELSAQDAHRHAHELALRGAGHRADAVRDVHAPRERQAGAAAARHALDAPRAPPCSRWASSGGRRPSRPCCWH